MTYYMTLIHGEEDGYGFTVPDVQGFTAFAATPNLEEAVAEARRVLNDHLALIIDEGLELPAARDLGALKADPSLREDFEDAEVVMLLPALVPAGRTRRVNVTLDENILDLIDRSAADRNLTRSAFIAEAARQLATA
jgi:predicted RNase H-like HicB family nuclease